jgi:RNA polymerase sigma-70 factor (ECF subfamily)
VELMARQRPRLRELAHRLLSRCARLDGSDVVQEVMLDLLHCPKEVRHGTDEEKLAWLRVLLACKVHHALRDQERAKRDWRRDRSAGTVNVEALGADPGPATDERALTQERAAALGAAIERLTGPQRQIVHMYFWDGKSESEIAARLGCDRSSVARLRRRGLRKLRELLGDRDLL